MNIVSKFIMLGYQFVLLTWSMLRVRVKGEQATREEAPLIIGAPHTSFLDALVRD
jgi:1-acyl-sn-glycerol-3-phosphate acyltransferase